MKMTNKKPFVNCPKCGEKVKWYSKEDGLHPIGRPNEPYFVCENCGLETDMFGYEKKEDSG